MHTVHPTLLIGPSDWQSERMPESEFTRRIDTLWQVHPTATRAIVYGSPRHHAELAYLTNLVPKLEAAVALLTRDTEPKLFLGGGPNMVGAAKPLTWISDLAPLRSGQAVGQTAVAGISAYKIVVIGGGAMPTAFRQSMNEAMGGEATDATADVWKQMAAKSSHEMAAIVGACGVLHAAVAAIDQSKHTSVTTAVLAGERAANQAGAQDVRILFSRNGGRTLEPFVTRVNETADPFQVYVAVRHLNYWAEGFAHLSARPNAAKSKAMDVLKRVLIRMRAGIPTRDIANLIESSIRSDAPHPVTMHSCLNTIGLGLEEAPYTDAGETIEAGNVYSLKAGLQNVAGQHAIVSATVAVHKGGNDVLWISP